MSKPSVKEMLDALDERWRGFHSSRDYQIIRAALLDCEKVQAERDELCDKLADVTLAWKNAETDATHNLAKIMRLEAELDALAPLVKAVESEGEITVVGTVSPKADRILRAALDLKAKKGEKK